MEKPKRTLVLVCGDRDWDDYDSIYYRLNRLDATTPGLVIITGGAAGADTAANAVAEDVGIPCAVVRAQWSRYGKAAGALRNRWMLDFKPDLVLYFHKNLEASRGTRNCVLEARKRGIPVESGV